jgi:hypothetical protein
VVGTPLAPFTDLMMSLSFFPSNGGYPVKRMYMITPIDQRSHFSSYFFPFTISGAM